MGVLQNAEGERVKTFCDGTGESALGSCAFRKGAKSAGRGGGVGGAGVVVRDRVGVDADGSNVRDSHSAVMACRSGLLIEG